MNKFPPPPYAIFAMINVRRYLAEIDNLGNAAHEEAAQYALMSRATLDRRLRMCQTAFRELVTAERVRRVHNYFVRFPHATADDLAQQAGYAHGSTLTQSFYDLFGTTMTEYRKGLLRDEKRRYRERRTARSTEQKTMSDKTQGSHEIR